MTKIVNNQRGRAVAELGDCDTSLPKDLAIRKYVNLNRYIIVSRNAFSVRSIPCISNLNHWVNYLREIEISVYGQIIEMFVPKIIF